MYYTTDGSDPRVAGSAAKKLDGSTLTVKPTGNTDHNVTVKAVAEKDGLFSAVSEAVVKFVKIPDLTSGTRVYLGKVKDGGVAGGPYDIFVRVTTTNGKITRIEDDGTIDNMDFSDNNADKDYAFWEGMGLFDENEGISVKLSGKTLSELLNAQTVPDDDAHNADAVSGATVWSDAIRHAAIAALRSEPVSESASSVLAPKLSVEDSCVPNTSYKYIDVTMSAAAGTTIRYTTDGTDPTETSTEAAKINWWSDDFGVRLNADPENNPNGQIVEVCAAAFDENGNRSDVVRQFCVFASPLKNADYVTNYDGASATVGGITATAVTKNPNFGTPNYITSLTLDREHSEEYAAFLPELFSRIYFAQTTEGVEPIAGHETESRAVLAAVQAALDKALTAAAPEISVSPEGTKFANTDAVTVMLFCPTDGAEIYYTVDNSNTLTGNTLSDPTKTGTKYTGPFTVSINSNAGGSIYIRAAAKYNGQWSSIKRLDLTFSAAEQTSE